MQSPCYRLSENLFFEPTKQQLYNELGEIAHTLGNNEAKALMILLDRRDQVVTRERLQEEVWRKQGLEVDDSSITQAISNLRKALNDDSKTPFFIRTIPKKGYVYIGDASPISFAEIAAANTKGLNLPTWQWVMWVASTVLLLTALGLTLIPKSDFTLAGYQTIEFDGINYHAAGVRPDYFRDHINDISKCAGHYKEQLQLQDAKDILIFRRNTSITMSIVDPKDHSAGRPNRSTTLLFRNVENWNLKC